MVKRVTEASISTDESQSSRRSTVRVILYSRVSTSRQAAHGISLDSQPDVLREYARRQGWQVVKEISDAGISGRTDQRRGFKELLETVKTYRPDRVVVTRLSRLGRNARLIHETVGELENQGVGLVCVHENIDTSIGGITHKLLWHITASMAELESELRGEYSRETRQRLISQGRLPSGRPPYGYTYDKKNGILVVDPERAGVVRLIYSLYTEGVQGRRLGMAAIVEELSLRRAIPSPSGRRHWNTHTVSKILNDKVYIGQHNLGVTVERPVIDEQTFTLAQRLRPTNRHLREPTKLLWPLQGRLRCAACGSNMTTHARSGYRYYRCPSRDGASRYYIENGQRCPTQNMRADRVEAAMWGTLVRTVSTPDEFAAVLERAIATLKSREKDLSQDVAPIQDRLEHVDAELQRVEWAYVRGNIEVDELDAHAEELKRQRQTLVSRLEALAPGRLDELHMTSARLNIAEDYLNGLRRTRSGDPSDYAEPRPVIVNDAESQDRSPEEQTVRLVPMPKSLKGRRSQFAETWLLLPGWEQQAPPKDRPVDRTAWQLSQAMTRLQAEVFVFEDHLELRGALEIDGPLVQASANGHGVKNDLYHALGDARTTSW